MNDRERYRRLVRRHMRRDVETLERIIRGPEKPPACLQHQGNGRQGVSHGR